MGHFYALRVGHFYALISMGNDVLFEHAVKVAPPAASASLLLSRAETRCRQGEWALAASDFGEADRLRPLVIYSPYDPNQLYLISLQASGDLAGLKRARATFLERSLATVNPSTAGDVAWICAQYAVNDTSPSAAVVLAEMALKGGPEARKELYRSALAAALYREGRFGEAVKVLMEIERRTPESDHRIWPFLAMAHQRLGHPGEARRWLDRARDKRVADSSVPRMKGISETVSFQIWDILLTEAEAVVLFDPIFPTDPFAS